MADEVSPEVISTTQKLLSRYVKRPPLTEKLLRKPPFRFLHDIVSAVVKDTGFLKGLFTDSELQSDNVKDRENKVTFLNKLISAVKTISGEDLQARASKIIAGLEATETNRLLQAIATSIDKKLDSKEYVAQLKSSKSKEIKEKDVKRVKEKSKGTSKETSKGTSNETSKDSSRKVSKAEAASVKSKESLSSRKSNDSVKKLKTSKVEKVKERKVKESPKGDEKVKKDDKIKKKPLGESPREKIKRESPRESKSKEKIKEQVKESPRESKSKEKNKEEVKESPRESSEVKEVEVAVNESSEVKVEGNEEVERVKTALVRPKSARPRSGDYKKIEAPEVEGKLEAAPAPSLAASTPAPMKATDIFAGTEQIKPEKVIKLDESIVARPRSSLRPPSVRPSSARPGAPRLRPDSAIPLQEMIPLGKINVIVENFGSDRIDDEDDEDTVVIQTAAEATDPILLEKSLDIPTDKGHLVEQILEQISAPGELEEHIKETINWEQERGRSATAKEITQLRASIQSLTKTANPLGKLMSYLHEDVEAMHVELDVWCDMRRQYSSEIEKQKRVNADSNQPLFYQLKELEDNLRKQKEEIAAAKFNVLRNEEKIKDLIGKQLIVQ